MQAASIAPIFTRLLSQSPVYVVWLGGGILALARWRHHPRVSLLALIGLGVLFASSLMSTTLNTALPLAIVWRAVRSDYARMGSVLGVCNIVFAVIAAIGYGLLLAAVFSERAPQPAVEKQDQP